MDNTLLVLLAILKLSTCMPDPNVNVNVNINVGDEMGPEGRPSGNPNEGLGDGVGLISNPCLFLSPPGFWIPTGFPGAPNCTERNGIPTGIFQPGGQCCQPIPGCPVICGSNGLWICGGLPDGSQQQTFPGQCYLDAAVKCEPAQYGNYIFLYVGRCDEHSTTRATEELIDTSSDAGMSCDPPNFVIPAGTQFGCPCSYYGAIEINAWPGGQCCKPTDCPNSNFTSLHVCGRDGSQACRNSTDALDFARQAWTDPAAIVVPFVFACTGITYNTTNDNGREVCVMERPQVDFPMAWNCTIESGVVTSCEDAGNCWINSYANDGSVIVDSLACYKN